MYKTLSEVFISHSYHVIFSKCVRKHSYGWNKTNTRLTDCSSSAIWRRHKTLRRPRRKRPTGSRRWRQLQKKREEPTVRETKDPPHTEVPSYLSPAVPSFLLPSVCLIACVRECVCARVTTPVFLPFAHFVMEVMLCKLCTHVRTFFFFDESFLNIEGLPHIYYIVKILANTG